MPFEPRYQCRHILTSGHRCQSPCLRREDFCYHHHTTRKPIANPAERRRRSHTFELPPLDDRTSVSLAISEIAQRLAANAIDPKRAGLLLYACQIASLNLPKPGPDPDYPAQTVEDVVEHPLHGPIAEQAEYREPSRQADPAEKLFRDPETGQNRHFEDILIDTWKEEATLQQELEAARHEIAQLKAGILLPHPIAGEPIGLEASAAPVSTEKLLTLNSRSFAFRIAGTRPSHARPSPKSIRNGRSRSLCFASNARAIG